MRITFVSGMSLHSWGGSEELWSRTAQRLRERGHTIAASVPFRRAVPARVTDLENKGINVCFHRSAQSPLMERCCSILTRKLRFRPREFSWLRSQKPDLVVVSQGGITDGLEWMTFCRQADIPYVVINQCNSESWWPTDEVAITMAKAYSSAERVYCVSNNNLDLLKRQISCPLPNASVVRNPYKLSGDKPCPWPAEAEAWKVACVARLEPAAKGQDLLFQVLSRPEWQRRELEVNLYGKGPSEESLRRLAQYQRLKNVYFRGYVEDVMEIWRHNHMLILPSRFEGLPLALVEAMFCGRPAIVTNVGGNTELCLNNITGFVVPAPRVEPLEETLQTAWERRTYWSQMGNAARARALELVPRDPVEDFCANLLRCFSTASRRADKPLSNRFRRSNSRNLRNDLAPFER